MKNHRKIILGICAAITGLVSACSILKQETMHNTSFPTLSYEGHRGARGLAPENSIEAMKMAIDLSIVTTLELDCHITKDHKVVAYHDHTLNPKFTQYNNGQELEGNDIHGLIYNYTWKDLAKFDIGSKGNADFPDQQKIKAHIPLLKTLIEEAEAYANAKNRAPMYYNIETKSSADKDHEYHPTPQEFSDLVLEIVIEKGIAPRTVIQSFDKRTIQYINLHYPQIKTSYLIEGQNDKSIKEIINELGFTPFIISPAYKLVDRAFLDDAHKLGIKVIPWTVNNKRDMDDLLHLKVDGIISDYPNLF